jgi:predicted DNA-binding transcriptional regulator YafY
MDKVIERFGEGNVISVEGDTCLAAYPIIHNEYGYDTLLRFGDKCEIIGPSEVRDGFRDYVGRILAKYEK